MATGYRTWTRRRLLAAGGAVVATAATAGASGFLLTRGSATSSKAAPLPPLPSPTPFPQAAATSLPRGGTARVVAPRSFNFDTFDAARSGDPTVLEVLGRTHSRLVEWADFLQPRLGGDLAALWEQPDAATFVLHLDPAARWHDRPPLNGRGLTAADAAASLDRIRQLASRGGLPGLQDATAYAAISRLTPVDSVTLRLETAGPDPFLLDTLAGRFALVQAPESVSAFEASWPKLQPASVVGSGPFVFASGRDGVLSLDAFREGHRPPALDRLAVSGPGKDDPARFLAGDLDEAICRDRRDAPRLRGAPGGPFTELARFEESPVVTTFFAGAPPWNNPELVRALSGALNRPELARRLFAGRAAPAAAVTPATPAFALPESELAAFPGYRPVFQDDAAEAARRWRAAGGPALGAVTIDFPNIFDPLYSASSIVIGMLNEVLGPQFRPAVDTYTAISARALDRQYGNGRAALWFGWAPPLSGPDPSRWLLDNFGPETATAASLGIAGRASHALDQLGAEFDLEARSGLVREVQRQHLQDGSPGLLTWLLQRQEVFRRPRLQRPAPVPFWSEHLDAEAWFTP